MCDPETKGLQLGALDNSLSIKIALSPKERGKIESTVRGELLVALDKEPTRY